MHEAYELVKEEYLSDIRSMGTVLRHKKSGARISLLSNDDDNKVFYIGFRTPPGDSTGVPHIIEHTVLCGSQKYPLKDPFVELVKGSLNTFLNAMTYPDKTVYPVASCNDQDFKNLMDVYMDAVFHPNIYRDPEIFMQEGWHYELEDEDGEIRLNGVVYNEMKGAFSSPDDVVSREVFNSLFPDNAYHYESGGDPKVIPQLTYEDFIAFHRRYYHPCNSYIYLYGNMDMEERLDYLDREYLSKYDKIELDSSIRRQEAFPRPILVDKYYPISSAEDGRDATYLAYTFVISDALDQELYQAFDILEYVLFSAPGAPVRTALLEKGIGKDIIGSFDTGMLQPMFSVTARGANPQDKQPFIDTIQEILLRQVAEGIDKKALQAGINAARFNYREADFGSFPKGLIYGLQCMDSWLYDDNEPFIHLHGEAVLDRLQEKAEQGYFEQLIQTYLLANTHASVLMVEPKKGMTTEEDEKLKEELKKYKESLSKDEIRDLIRQTKLLKQHQQEPSTKEQLECLPMLRRQDLKKEARPLDLAEREIDGVTVLHHDVPTNGIHYLDLVFDIKGVDPQDYGYLSLMVRMLGLLDTERYGYAELANEINIHTGGIYASLSVYAQSSTSYRFVCEVKDKFLYEDAKEAVRLLTEVLATTDFSDENRLKELISAQKSRLEVQMSSAGNVVAASRAMGYYSEAARITDEISGIAFYRFLKDLEENYEAKVALIREKCRSLCSVFCKENLLVSCTGDGGAYRQLEDFLPQILSGLHAPAVSKGGEDLPLFDAGEGFKDASQVQYVCRAGNFMRAGYPYSGYLKILKVILSYDYFWVNVRVKGGAYGCRSFFGRTGDLYFVSYRDPNLRKTNEIFENTPEYIRQFAADERDMTKYIIGTVSEMDTPLTPSQRGSRALAAYLTGTTFEELQRIRDEVLNATAEDIRGLEGLIRDTLAQGYLCVVGNEDMLEKESEMFERLENLF